MNLGEKLRTARLELGLSQRQLCGEKITRNMLSQIENGTARPSMDTLIYLAARLGKPSSYFLDGAAVASPNLQTMSQARDGYARQEYDAVLDALKSYQEPDTMFEQERWLLTALAALALAEHAAEQGRKRYAAELLAQSDEAGKKSIYWDQAHNRRLMLLKATLYPEMAAQLPGLDKELYLRTQVALDAGNATRAGALLDAVEDKSASKWHFLRGEVYFLQNAYDKAAEHYHQVEKIHPEKTAPRLEQCYRELRDFEKAYYYACLQR